MEFKIFTYEEYEEIFNYLLSDIRDNTVVSKEDIKQEILIYLLRKEEKVFNNNSIENKRGYIVQLLKNHLKTLKGKFIYNNINHYDIDDYSEVLTEDIHYENSLINDIVIDDTLVEFLNNKEKSILLDKVECDRYKKYRIYSKLKRKLDEKLRGGELEVQ